MTTITLSETGTLQLPPNIVQLFGLTKGTEFEVITSKKGVMLASKTQEQATAQDLAYKRQKIKAVSGMVTVTPPKGFNLFEFDVADHITLFDED